MRVSAVNTELSQPFRRYLKKDAARLLEALATDFSFACAPASPATYVLVMGLRAPYSLRSFGGEGRCLRLCPLGSSIGPRHSPLFC